MITDLDRPELSRPASRWPLPVVTGLCVAAFIGLAVSVSSVSSGTRHSAVPAPPGVTAKGLPDVPPAWAAARAGEAGESWQFTRDLAPLGPVVAVPPSWQVREAELERQSRTPSLTLSLTLPATAYKTVTRVASSVTTGLYPADEEVLVQLRYRLLDDRIVLLVRLPPSDPLRGVNPASYTVDSVIVRGIEARMLSGRTAIEPTILLWTEASRSYQLYSSTLSGPELIQVAELLR